MASPLLIAKSGSAELQLLPALANRHGLITGGTGKTVTLQAVAASAIAGHYEKVVDRESAYEKIKARARPAEAARPAPREAPQGGGSMVSELLFGKTGPRGAQRDGLMQTLAKSAVRTMGSQVGREIIRGMLGSILGGGRRR